MNQKQRDKKLYDEPFATLNLPISIFRRDGDNKPYSVIVSPRKEEVWNNYKEPMTEEELKEYCDIAIALYGNAVELFQLLKEGKIDHIYTFKSPEKAIEEKKNDDKEKALRKLYEKGKITEKEYQEKMWKLSNKRRNRRSD